MVNPDEIIGPSNKWTPTPEGPKALNPPTFRQRLESVLRALGTHEFSITQAADQIEFMLEEDAKEKKPDIDPTILEKIKEGLSSPHGTPWGGDGWCCPEHHEQAGPDALPGTETPDAG